jgi:hypothetical protein
MYYFLPVKQEPSGQSAQGIRDSLGMFAMPLPGLESAYTVATPEPSGDIPGGSGMLILAAAVLATVYVLPHFFGPRAAKAKLRKVTMRDGRRVYVSKPVERTLRDQGEIK